ncbi:MAG: tRNA (adenosine(37)-N6)-dimethylallyltransferase MiaA [Epsilonproteobacteria bacterium]|nr:tRNA (adenosine(37)-N6)-dimethylallyltransferase MiaA [Campylobacterota bacterium]
MIALIGPTASGKSDLAIEIALKHGYEILSLDSLSIYKQVDIASAKPSKEDLALVRHYGVDEILPNQKFDVMKFISIYQQIKHKKLIIVGGSSFYLKAMLNGISTLPTVTDDIKKQAAKYDWEFLYKIDPIYAQKIYPTDTYRLSRAIEIYLATSLPPSEYFRLHPPTPVLDDVDIYEIKVRRDTLRQRIVKRTQKMFDLGLIDEVAFLEATYQDRQLPALKAIGVREVLDYFDGKYTKDELKQKIITNTARLAKRQQTFNKTQFNATSLPLERLREILV